MSFYALHSATSTVLIEAVPNEAPLWRYWGPRLPDGTTPGSGLRDTRPLPSFMLDVDQPLSVLPTFGVGWMGQSALLAHRAGSDFAQGWTACSVEESRCGAGQNLTQSLTLTLTDAVARVRAVLVLGLESATDMLSLRTTLTNTGDAPLDVQWLAAGTLPLPGACRQVRYWAGQHNHEFLECNAPLDRHLWQRESRRGRTSHDCFPGAVVMEDGATAHSGTVYAAHLAWSGNHRQCIEWLHDGQYQWQMGEWLAPGEGLLAPGASLATPELLACCSPCGWDGAAQRFHQALRQRMAWPGGAMRPRPVHLNTWEGFYFDVHPGPVLELARAAAEVGVERFVLDDGWFHGRHHDRAGLGDWWPDAGKFPEGLGELIAQVNALGMGFGLWVEPEMANPDSDLLRAHPDWALQIAGRPLITARNQLVLDISRPEVSDHLFDQIAALLRAHPIEYLKWDHNRDLAPAGLASGHAGYRAQVHAAWALMDRLRTAFPQVEIESCSGGGGRIDFGVLARTHRVWTSDCIDALTRVELQRGYGQFFPPEIMGAHIGTAPAHTTGRSQSMAFRAAVALPGHLGVELDVRHLSADGRRGLAAWIALYKSLRGTLHGGRVWRGAVDDGIVWQAHAGPGRDTDPGTDTGTGTGADSDTDDILVLVYRTQPTTHRYTPVMRLPFLAGLAQPGGPKTPGASGASRAYRVQRLLPEGVSPEEGRHPGNSAPFFDALEGDGARMDGAWLAQHGLPLPRGLAETALLLRLRPLERDAAAATGDTL